MRSWLDGGTQRHGPLVGCMTEILLEEGVKPKDRGRKCEDYNVQNDSVVEPDAGYEE